MGMDEIAGLLILFIIALVSIVIAGLIAGFSPTLYIAQAAISMHADKKGAKHYTYMIIGGVLLAIVLLLVFFQTINLDTLLSVIDSSVDALFVSVSFNAVVGLLFIFGGMMYIRSRKTEKTYETSTKKKAKKAGGMSAAFGLGLTKTFLSISGVTAVFIGGNIIASTANTFVDHIIYTLVFLAAAVAPFLVMLYFIQNSPQKLQGVIDSVKNRMTKVNYRLTVGVAAIILGAAILIFNIMMALLY